MTRRDIAAEDEDTVCVWVCRTRGSQSELGARADRQLAQAWVERRLESDGEWHGNPERGKQVFKTDTVESGSIEIVPIHDVVGILLKEP